MNTFNSYVYFMCTSLCFVMCFNIDTKFPIIFQGSKDSYFGYTVALIRNREGNKALVAAPRANSTELTYIKQPGVLYNCKISFNSRTQTCNEIVLDKNGNIKHKSANSKFSYQDMKDGMFLGVSLDVQQNTRNAHIVTCGHIWKNQLYDKIYLANGACYVIDNELDTNSVQKLVPLVFKDDQSIIPPGIYLYAYAQAGTSAVFSEDGKQLLLGAPGFYDWSGTVISYDTPSSGHNFGTPVIPRPPFEQKLSPESYIGYAVAAGRFFEDLNNYVAIGAPRDKGSNGQVYIVRPLKEKPEKLSVYMKKEGTQFGEYFGSSITAVNVNNDKFTDLLVGAPFYSTETGGDEGKVYVYISDGEGLEPYAELYGDKLSNARFGSCITSIGDINQDGFTDIGIGAPYEEISGAIYIYHGTSSGINKEYAQRITASEISSSLTGFGISISRGLDIDNNYYPDILVGSYSSSNAVLLRTQPIISLISRLEFSPHQINTNTTSCEYEGVKVPCINVTACLQYTIKHNQFNMEFETELHMDLEKLNAMTLPRGYLIQRGRPVSVIRQNMKLKSGTEMCITHESYIQANAKDIITPVDFTFKYALSKDSRNTSFCKQCAIVDPNSPSSLMKLISFQTQCRKDNKCLSNLVVTAIVAGNPKNDVLIIGQNTTLTIDISVINIGEPAYSAELFIYLPEATLNVNQDFCAVLTDQQKLETNASLQCNLGNPLQNGHKVEIQIKIDISKLPTTTEKVMVRLEAKTVSTEIDPNDNERTIPISFKAVADVSITGIAEQEQISVNYTDKTSILITHSYFVMNFGPSPIQTINIDLLVPTSIKTNNEFLEFLSFDQFEADSGEPLTVPAKCNDTKIEIQPNASDDKKLKDEISDDFKDLTDNRAPSDINRNSSLAVEDKEINANYRSKKSLSDIQGSKGKDLVIDCKTATCMLIQCVAAPFTDSRKFAKITISLRLNSSVLNQKLEPWYRIEFKTQGRISIRDATSNIQPTNHHPDEASIKTTLVRPGPPPSQEVAKWIIFISIGIGILLLFIILVTLIKIGFFKRQQKEKMQQMMMQADLKEWEPYLIPNEEQSDNNAQKET